MGWLGWAIVLGGPVLCALAGAGCEHFRTIRNIGERLDLAYDQAWQVAMDHYRTLYGSMQLDVESTLETVAKMLPAAPVVAAERLAALPAVHHEGGRHARPEHPSQPCAYDPLIDGIGVQFDAIRVSLGLVPSYMAAVEVSP